jgi:NhaA family Na+:H+ antiporter
MAGPDKSCPGSSNHVLFLSIEAASGVLLMIAAALALVWANSPWQAPYEGLWHHAVLEHDLHFWINEGLMTVFFFVVGLEIRREIHAGELQDLRRAALPLAAAIGGMAAPAILFLALNASRPSAAGWAIPTATDIAFAVGTLAILGKRVRPSLRILLLALAVIDDVGAIAVIALFYSGHLALAGFAVAGLGLLLILIFQRLGIQSPFAYFVPAVVVWIGAYVGGIHPTLAGVAIGLMTPVSVVGRLQHSFHGWVAFGIMPLFAFANAGVPLGQIELAGDKLWLFLGVTLGLAVGKPLGILFASWLAARSGVAALPQGIGWSSVGVVGMVGGIGFTMALFIAQLAFPEGDLLAAAKLGVLCGSGLAAILSLVAGYRILCSEQSC